MSATANKISFYNFLHKGVILKKYVFIMDDDRRLQRFNDIFKRIAVTVNAIVHLLRFVVFMVQGLYIRFGLNSYKFYYRRVIRNLYKDQ